MKTKKVKTKIYSIRLFDNISDDDEDVDEYELEDDDDED